MSRTARRFHRRMPAWFPLRVRQSVYERVFLGNADENLFMGSFGSLAEAAAAVPPSKPVGYDNAEASAGFYSHQIYNWDYPALFWIGKSFDQGMKTVFDIGGHVGIKFYAFRRVLNIAPDLRWTVCDVPAVVKVGQGLAKERHADAQLRFTDDFREASGCDVLFLSGSLQYLPTQIGEILGALAVKPRRIILNITAMHPGKTLFTLNSIGIAVCPYRIQHDEELMAEIVAAGYSRRDSWRNEGKPIAIPFVDGGDMPYYGGGCFDLK